MYSPSPNRSHGLREVKFKAVPEVRAEHIGLLFGMIRWRKRLNRSSFGAFVVRNGTNEVLADCIREMCKPEDEVGVSEPIIFMSLMKRMHSDGGLPNEMTIHHAVAGTVEAIVLVGSKPVAHEADRGPATKRLFEESRLDTEIVSLPDRAYRTEINQADILVLDHSQIHTVKSLTAARESHGYVAVRAGI